MDVNNPLKMVLIGIDSYPYDPYNFATLSQCRITHIKKKQGIFNGNFRILKWRYVNVPYFWPYFLGIFPEI